MTMLKPKEMAERLNVTVRTLQRWDNDGVLKAYRTPTNRRYYTEEQYLEYMGQSQTVKDPRKVVAYARVSSNGQKDDLKNQVQFLRDFANGKGIILDDVITDIGSGLNYKRKTGTNFLMKLWIIRLRLSISLTKIDLFALAMTGLKICARNTILKLWCLTISKQVPVKK